MPRPSYLVDAADVEHPPAAADARIVSLVPSITELVCDLGLRTSLVGCTNFCVHPAAVVDGLPKVGGTKDVDLDRLRALAPSHVIVNIDENRRDTAAAIRAAGCRVIVTHPQAPQDNRSLYRLLGALFGRDREATALVDRFDRVFDTVRERAAGLPARKVVYLIWRKPWMTVSCDTYISRMLAVVGLHTLPGDDDSRYPAITLPEKGWASDLVLLSSEPFPFRRQHVEELRVLGAGRLRPRLIDGELVSWYGSRAIRGLQYLLDYARTTLAVTPA